MAFVTEKLRHTKTVMATLRRRVKKKEKCIFILICKRHKSCQRTPGAKCPLPFLNSKFHASFTLSVQILAAFLTHRLLIEWVT